MADASGMGTRGRNVTVGYAIRVGYVVVNGPVFLLMIGVAATGIYLDLEGITAVVLAFAIILVPWAWWSFAAPRWRIWALERTETEEWDTLLDTAVASQILWPTGHFFERTEISTRRVREREREIGWRK